MNKSKTINFILILVICFCIFPNFISALSIKHSKKWTSSVENNGLGFDNVSYYTLGYGKRETKYIGGFRIIDDKNTKASEDRVFCVEPAVKFPTSGTVERYSSTKTAPTTKDGYHWNIAGGEEYLKKVLSCWTENTESIVATQAIVWELVSEERDGINATEILGDGDYVPHKSDGTTYGNKSGITSLYELIKNHRDLYEAYKSVLRCAARFNITPSFSKESAETAKSSPSKLSSYDDESQTFSASFKINSAIEPKILKYYTVTSSDSAVKVSKTDTGISVSTNKEISKENPVKITLEYTYKDNGTSKLNSLSDSYTGKYDDYGITYYVKESDKTYQALARGGRTKISYLYVWTGAKPTYQLKVKKTDEYGNPMSGVKFDIYSDASLEKKIGTTTATDEDGWAYLKGIKTIGKYYIKEAETPDGYKTNSKVVDVTITGENRVGTNSYATASQVFVNSFMHLSLDKKTIDENGNVIDIVDYSESNCTGTYSGPTFMLKKDNKDICVISIDGQPGKYRLAESCTASGATKEIKTCTGKFDIEGIKSGCYSITEINAPNGMTLPTNPTQLVCVEKGQSATATVMYNGVSGVVFNKVTENGKLLDGGKYALQKRVNGIYKDILLQHKSGVIYSYVEDLKEETENATYILETNNGTINVQNLPIGEYRFVEKQAPDGYDMIKEKDSNATFTISDKGIFGEDGNPVLDFYQVKLVNQKSRVKGSYDSAELIVTIITGRKVANYALIIAGLAVLLTLFIILRNKFKK